MNPNMLMGLVAVLAVANLGLVATTTMVVNDVASDEDSSDTMAPEVQPDPIGNAAAIYVKFDGIDGESTDENHDKWIEVLSWSHDRGAVDRSDNIGSSGMDGVASTSIVLTKELDKASPKLAEMLSTGGTTDVEFEIFSLVEYNDNNDLVLRKRPGRMVQSGMLTNASIMHQTTMPVVLLPESGGTDQSHMTTPGHKYIDTLRVMGEEISLSYEKITWTYDTGGKEHEDDWVSPRVLAANDIENPYFIPDTPGEYGFETQFNTTLTFDTPGRGPGDIPHKTEIDQIGLRLAIHQPGGGATGQSRRRGVHQPGGSATGATRRRGDVIMEDITLVKELDKASPKLAEALANGEPLENATIILTERGSGGGGGTVYLKIELEEAIVSSYSSGTGSTRAPDWRVEIEFPDRDVSSSSGGFDTEMVSLSFHMANITYPGAGPNGTDMVLSADPMLPRDGRVFTSTFLHIHGFEGDVEIEGREGTVLLHELGHAMGDPHTRWDPLMLDLSRSSVSFTKYIDKASPLLMRRMNDGGTLNATIFVDEYRTHSNGSIERVEYMKYELKNVMVTSVSTGGSGGEDKLTENVSLNFEEVKTTYVEMKESATYIAGDPREDQYSMDMFLDIEGEGFEGESTARGHKDEIDVLAWSWGVSQSGSFHVGGGGGAGKANFQDITIVKPIDKSSPMLMQAWANGDSLGNGTLSLVRRGETSPMVEVEMISMQLTSIRTVSFVPEIPTASDESGEFWFEGLQPGRYVFPAFSASGTGNLYEEITLKPIRLELAYADPGDGSGEIKVVLKHDNSGIAPPQTEITVQYEGLRGFDPNPDDLCYPWRYETGLHVSTDRQSGKIIGTRMHSPFSIETFYDPASPFLRQALTTGDEFNVTVSVNRVAADGSKENFYRYKLVDAIVSSYSVSGSTGGDLPTEQISFLYETMTTEYVLDGIKEDDPGVFGGRGGGAIYLHVNGIEGESTDSGHEGWIDVLSIDWGLSSTTRDAASGLPTGKRQHEPVELTIEYEKASPKLQEALTSGTPLDATVEIFEIDENGTMVHTVTLNMTEAEIISIDSFNGHVTPLKGHNDASTGQWAYVDSGSTVRGFDTEMISMQLTSFRYSELSVYYEQTGDHFFDIWVDPEPRAGFIKLGDIKGEATDADHNEWIEVTGYQHSVTREFAGYDLRDNETEGRLLHTPFIFTKVFDSSSPSIMDTYLNGSLIGVTMDVTRPMAAGASGSTRTAVTVTLENASIESYELNYLDDDDDGDGIPVETVSLRYSHVEWKVEEGESLRSEWYDPSMAPKTRASFIKFDGIDGESKDIDHDGWSDLVAVRYSVSEEIEGATGLPTGKTEVSSVVVVKPVDASSPFLLMSVARGDVYDVTIERYQPDLTAADGRVHYLTIELENASVERAESIDDDCDSDCDDTWDDMEEISLRFESMKWTWELLGIEHEDIG